MQNSFCAREEKEHEGEDFYGTYVPALSVGNVLRVAPYDVFSGIDSLIPAVHIRSCLRSFLISVVFLKVLFFFFF